MPLERRRPVSERLFPAALHLQIVRRKMALVRPRRAAQPTGREAQNTPTAVGGIPGGTSVHAVMEMQYLPALLRLFRLRPRAPSNLQALPRTGPRRPAIRRAVPSEHAGCRAGGAGRSRQAGWGTRQSVLQRESQRPKRLFTLRCFGDAQDRTLTVMRSPDRLELTSASDSSGAFAALQSGQ